MILHFDIKELNPPLEPELAVLPAFVDAFICAANICCMYEYAVLSNPGHIR